MDEQHTYFPRTTVSQRRLLFETWEATQDVAAACRTAHVCRQTFYNWKPRFAAGGSAALERFASFAPKTAACTPPAVAARVLALRRAHPTWGKTRLADELAKANQWVPLVSPNTVRRILGDAGFWPAAPVKKGGPDAVTRTAEQPGQTVNVDLCFVPAQHAAAAKLPAVSGSSGRLVVETPAAARNAFPGQVFADPELDYAAAMAAYVAASQPVEPPVTAAVPAPAAESGTPKAQKQAWRRTAEQVRAHRRQVRAHRRQENAAWAAARQRHRSEQAARRQPSRAARAPRPAPDAAWPHVREQRRQQQAQRQREDAQWRQQRTQLRAQLAQLPSVTAWIAILVLTDNGTRQCLGLPLFVAGPHVTSDLIIAALRTLLPADLQFLISDRGVHFRANSFAQFAHELDFSHVLIARHRPESNGIAERFVRTLKEWLAEHDWQTADQLLALLVQCQTDYNDRPHQGLPIPGLSPNEFAKRIWLF